MIDLIKEIVRNICEYEIFFGKYRIGESDTILTSKDLELVSIKGREYLVFRYHDKIVKIHKKYFFEIYALVEENVKSLIAIPTKRILLPEECVYDDKGNIQGYTMQEVKNSKSITNELMDHILEEMYILFDDKELLTQEGIVLIDLNLGNAVYNGGLYLIDSGRYSNVHIPTCFANIFPREQMREELTEEQKNKIITNNRDIFNRFIAEYLLIESSNIFNRRERIAKLKSIRLYLYNEAKEHKTDNYIQVIESTCSKNMTVDEYARFLMKKAN